MDDAGQRTVLRLDPVDQPIDRVAARHVDMGGDQFDAAGAQFRRRAFHLRRERAAAGGDDDGARAAIGEPARGLEAEARCAADHEMTAFGARGEGRAGAPLRPAWRAAAARRFSRHARRAASAGTRRGFLGFEQSDTAAA